MTPKLPGISINDTAFAACHPAAYAKSNTADYCDVEPR